MAADDQFEAVGDRRRNGGDHERGVNARAKPSCGRRRHRGRRFSRGNETKPVRILREIVERGLDQDTGFGRSDTSPDNRQEIVSKIRE
jgi:hypothetical protein